MGEPGVEHVVENRCPFPGCSGAGWHVDSLMFALHEKPAVTKEVEGVCTAVVAEAGADGGGVGRSAAQVEVEGAGDDNNVMKHHTSLLNCPMFALRRAAVASTPQFLSASSIFMSTRSDKCPFPGCNGNGNTTNRNVHRSLDFCPTYAKCREKRMFMHGSCRWCGLFACLCCQCPGGFPGCKHVANVKCPMRRKKGEVVCKKCARLSTVGGNATNSYRAVSTARNDRLKAGAVSTARNDRLKAGASDGVGGIADGRSTESNAVRCVRTRMEIVTPLRFSPPSAAVVSCCPSHGCLGDGHTDGVQTNHENIDACPVYQIRRQSGHRALGTCMWCGMSRCKDCICSGCESPSCDPSLIGAMATSHSRFLPTHGAAAAVCFHGTSFAVCHH